MSEEPLVQAGEALVERHVRCPAQVVARRPRVEPVGGTQLLGEESGDGRLVAAKARPQPLDPRAGTKRHAQRHLAGSEGHTGRSAR